MVYREQPPETSCYRHAASGARATCAACLQPICDICESFDQTRVLCPPCARRRHRLRMATRAAIGLCAVAVVGAALFGIGYVVTREKPFDYGVHASEVRAQTEEADREPCDRKRVLTLTETQLKAGDNRGALKRADAFFRRCGAWPRLLWVTYSAHERLSEHELAIADATKLIEQDPNDKDYWWWRGAAYREKGELEKAAADFQQSLTVEPALLGIPFDLANVYERLGRPCDAMKAIEQFLVYHPDVRDRARVDERLERLNKMGKCAR
jgi:tetratricopeptide (TPR) repeat protein